MTLLRCKFKELLKHLTIRSYVCSDIRFKDTSNFQRKVLTQSFQIVVLGQPNGTNTGQNNGFKNQSIAFYVLHVERRLVFVLVSRSSRGKGWIAKYMNSLVTGNVGCHFQTDLATIGEVVRYDGGYQFGLTYALVSISSQILTIPVQ